MARRDDREYREYLSEEQRSQRGSQRGSRVGVERGSQRGSRVGVERDPNAAAALGWSGDASPVECSQTFATGC